jgi:hypothetical protein
LAPPAAVFGVVAVVVLLAPGACAGALVTPGAVAAGAVGVVVVAGGAVGEAAAAVVTVRVIAAGAGPESPASFTSAAARMPSARAATTANATIGAFHPGAAARRVRAAAPQRRHHS